MNRELMIFHRSSGDLRGGDVGGDVLARIRAQLRSELRLQDHQRPVQQPRVSDVQADPSAFVRVFMVCLPDRSDFWDRSLIRPIKTDENR